MGNTSATYYGIPTAHGEEAREYPRADRRLAVPPLGPGLGLQSREGSPVRATGVTGRCTNLCTLTTEFTACYGCRYMMMCRYSRSGQ
jgi:hypothetical protein